MRKKTTTAMVLGVVALTIMTAQLASTATAATARSPLSGSWTGTYGGTFRGTFTLHWTQVKSHLSGTINLKSAGASPISGSVRGSTIRFGTLGPGTHITYSGSVSGGSMSGSYKTPSGGGSWSAHKK